MKLTCCMSNRPVRAEHYCQWTTEFQHTSLLITAWDIDIKPWNTITIVFKNTQTSEKVEQKQRVNMRDWRQNDGTNTCFQITTKTMSEMMTMTRSTSTAAATVSSGWGPVQEESRRSHVRWADHMWPHVSVVMTNEMRTVKHILWGSFCLILRHS